MNEPIPPFLARDADTGAEHDHHERQSSAVHAPPAARVPARTLDDEVGTLVRDLDMERTAFIPAGMRVTGNIETEGELSIVVFGNVEGNIISEHGIYVMAGGRVQGHIASSGEVVIAGTVLAEEGTPAVETQGRFSLAAGGQVTGDVKYKSLRVHEGGVVRGRLMPVES